MLWGSSPVHLLLEEFEKKKKTNSVDPAARAGVKNVILFYFILFLVESILLCTPKWQPPGELFSQIWIQEKYESKISF